MIWYLLGALRQTTSSGNCDKPQVEEKSMNYIYQRLETPCLNSLGTQVSHQTSPSLVDETNVGA